MSRLRIIGLALTILALTGMSIIGIRWIHYRLTHAITNAVFVESDTFTRVAYKRVSGRVERLFKEEGEYVKKGEALAKVDDRDYRLKLEEVEKNIESLKKEIEALEVKLDASRKEILANLEGVESEIEAIGEEIKSIDASIEQLERDRKRFSKLLSKGVIPSRKLEEIETRLRILIHKRETLRARMKRAGSTLKVLESKLEGLGSLNKKIDSLRRKLEAFEKKRDDLLNLVEETTLKSPVDGYVVKRYVSVGEVVRPGQFVYAVYDPEDIYILVLLEETKLRGVEKGNKVVVKVDAYPDEKFEGVVEEIGRATAAKFALIPRDVTAGEFTKVAQRIPVKVRILKGRKELLRIGMGGEVAIEKRARLLQNRTRIQNTPN